MKSILSILSIIAMILSMCTVIALPVMAEEATPFTSIYEEHEISGIWTSAGTEPDGRTTYRSAKKIAVEAGDKLYFGPCRTDQGGHLYLWVDENKAPLISNASDALEIADIFPNGDVLYCYTAPQAGEVGIVCYKTYIDSFVITKNEPITAENFFDYWEAQNSSMDLSRYSTAPKLSANSFTAITETPGYYKADGTINSSTNYYPGEIIDVKAGDVVYFGPYDLTTSQTSYLYDWHGTEGFTDYTKLTKELALDSPRTHIAATFPNGQVIFAYEVAGDGRIGLFTRTAYAKMFFISKNVRITEENFYEYWDFHSTKCKDYSSLLGRYNNVVPKESVLNGKSALFVGDSLCAAAADEGFFKEYNGAKVPGWAGRVALYYGLGETVNNGVSGAALSNTRDRWYNETGGKKQGRIYWQIASEAKNKYDYIVIEGGGNDAWDSVEVGTVSDGFEWEDFDLTTYAGGLEAAIYQAVKYHPEAAIGYMSIFRMPNCTNGRLGDAREYFEMGEKICEKWGIPYLDLYNTLTAETFDTTVYTHDTVHAVAAGYNVIAPYVGDWMETLKPYSDVKKDHEKTVIACVGDSLTKGEKSGDVTRYSYPAYLQEMLGDENYEVLNFGWGGASAQTSTNSYTDTYQYKKSIQYDPDQVIIMLGANDVRLAWDTTDNAGSCANYKAALKALAEEYLNLPSKPTVYLATPPYINRDSYLEVYNEGGLLAVVKEIATELNIKVIDTYTPTSEHPDLITEDNSHYSAAGYNLIASTIYEGITGETAPAVVPVTEKDTAVEETNPAKPLIRNWKAYYETADAFRIETVEDVEIFGDLISAGYTFAGKTVYLENDLDFAGINFKPLGATSGKNDDPPDYTRAFQGTFDGQKHVFSNVNIHCMYYTVGLFPVLYGATIKDFGLDGGSVEGYGVVGAISAYADYGVQMTNVWSSANVYGLSNVSGIVVNMRQNDAVVAPKLTNVACYGMISGGDYLYGISSGKENATLQTENTVFGGILDLHVKTNNSTPFVSYSETTMTGVASGYYTTEEAEMKTIYVTDVEAVRFNKKAFRNGEFATYMNAQSEAPVWTQKYGYAVPFADENNATPIAVTVNDNTVYTDYAGKLEGLETGSYWYLNGALTALVDMPESFTEEGTVLTLAISAAGADFDGDGNITTADATMLLRYLDHKDSTMTEIQADVNADGKVKVFDVVRLLQVIRDLPVA